MLTFICFIDDAATHSKGCKLVKVVDMSRTILGAQGGTLINGSLFVGGNAAKIYEINLETGETSVVISRPLDFEMVCDKHYNTALL